MSPILFIKKYQFYFLLGMFVISIGMFAPFFLKIWIGIPITILCYPCVKWCFKKCNQYYLEEKSAKNKN